MKNKCQVVLKMKVCENRKLRGKKLLNSITHSQLLQLSILFLF